MYIDPSVHIPNCTGTLVQLYFPPNFGRHHVDTSASASERMVNIDAIDRVIFHVIAGCSRVAVTGCASCDDRADCWRDMGELDPPELPAEG